MFFIKSTFGSFHLIRIRAIQIKRMFLGAGLYGLILLPIFLLSIFISFNYFKKAEFAPFICLGLFTICFYIQFIRDDLTFIHHKMASPFIELYIEYAVLSLPLLLPALFTENKNWFIIYFIMLLAVPLWNPTSRKSTKHTMISKIINPSDFEWISGIRKSYLSLITLWFFAFSTCWLKFAPLFILWVVTTLFISFYETGEPLHLLRARNEKPLNFLRNKSYRHMLYHLVICLPVLTINTLVYPEFWLINLLFLTTQISLLIFYIYFKYTMYIPEHNLKANSIITGVVSISSLVPYLFPIPVIMASYYFFKAKNNLNSFLYD